MLLEGRVAIVTGAAQGIGRAIARELACHGAWVAVADIQEERARETAGSLAGEGLRAAIAVGVDVSSYPSVRGMVERVHAEWGRIDVLVNNAALYSTLQRKPFWEIDEPEWDRVLAVNLRGPFFTSRAVFPVMRQQGYGKIVNISSSSIYNPRNNLVHYVASKAGVIGLTRALAREMGPHGIRVNAIAPGATATEANIAISSPERLQASARQRCLARVQLPEDLPGAVVFLASALSDFMTGQTLVVDGGQAFLG